MQMMTEQISVLAVDCPADINVEGDLMNDLTTVHLTSVHSTKAALSAIRVMHFDLMLTGTTIAGDPIWDLAAKVRTVRPKLRWVLIAKDLSLTDERHARTLGVTTIAPSWQPFANAQVRSRHGLVWKSKSS